MLDTGGDLLEEEEEDWETYRSELPPSIQTLMDSCKGGSIIVSNKGSQQEKDCTAEQIIHNIRVLVENNGGEGEYYRIPLIDRITSDIDLRIERLVRTSDNIQTRNPVRRPGQIHEYEALRLAKEETETEWLSIVGGAIVVEFNYNLLFSKHGWKEGSGLGKSESGIKEAIKVNLKQDTHGVGHKKGDEFAFHWWDHVFNKAASNISVNTTKDGVELSKSKDTQKISTTTTKTFDNKAMLYGKFLKAATLSNGNYKAMNKQNNDSEEEEDGDNITPRIQDMEDAELLRACGGMTGHKAARHGHKLNGKLARIEEQEALLLAKYRTGKPKVKESKNKMDKDRHLNGQDVDDTVMINSAKDRKKKDKSERRKRKREKEDSVRSDMEEVSKYTEKLQGDDMSAQEGMNLKKKKKKDKKKKSERKECESEKKIDANISETELGNKEITQTSEEISEEVTKIKKKRKKDKQMKSLESCDNNGDNSETVSNNNDVLNNTVTKKRKKSKKQKKEKM
ncbi:G patch domain-containing protein 4-like [Argopecten irradians]|uniref:G patch domain-containing protein 4-like n=1 Tax=Argopecten irradians TaxID=31199 RepID=UPI003715864D